jgi:dipeptidyl aminopeptidase/acylaminoacyl peptidase
MAMAADRLPHPPSIADRYAAADRYMGAEMARMIVNGDLHATFSSDGRTLLYRLGHVGRRDIMALDLSTGQSRKLADELQLATLIAQTTGKEVDPAKLALEQADFGAETGELSFSIADTRWKFDRNGVLAKADRGAPDGDGAVSPDGRFEVLARDYNLFARDRRSGREVALTTDGTREAPYGRGIPTLPDILAQGTEEPRMPVGVQWSPDSRRIATFRIDTTGVQRMSMTQENPPGSFYPRSFHYVYPLAGAEKLPQTTRYAIDVADALKRRRAKPVQLAVPVEAMLYPASPDLSWSNGRVRASWTARGYGEIKVFEADPATGAATVTAREAVKPVVTVTSSFFYAAPALGGELDVSERTGWAQLYLVRPDDPDGGIPLTRGEWEVTGIAHVDAAARAILLTGIGRERDRNPYFQGLYRVVLNGSQPILLTPEPLDHETTVSPDGKWFVDAMSSAVVPTRTVLRSTEDGRIVAELGKADATALYASGFTPPEPFRGLAADGKTPVYAQIYRPAHFDPTRQYPIIDNVYTGPTTNIVPPDWYISTRATPNNVAQIGAVVVQIDARGTSHRGQAFRLPAYQNLGEVGLDDHIAIIRQIAARYPYIDLNRVGVFGGSAGGYDAARFILRRPEFFKVSVAFAGNHDLRLDKAWWPEVSMGNPDASVWERNSNMSVAKNLTGKLLLVHGDIDDNVPVTETMRLANAIVTAGRDVDVVILSNTTHNVYQPFFWRKLRDYFTTHLLGETPPPLPLPKPDPVVKPDGVLSTGQK